MGSSRAALKSSLYNKKYISIFNYEPKDFSSYGNIIDKFVHVETFETFVTLAKRAVMIIDSNFF